MLFAAIKSKTLLFTLLLAFCLSFAYSIPVKAADSYCFCHKDLNLITPDTLEREGTQGDAYWKTGCQKVTDQFECAALSARGSGHPVCNRLYDSPTDCRDAETIFDAEYAKRIRDAGQAGLGTSKGGSAFIPDCALQDELTDECKDISIFIILAINIANYMFSIIGALALLMFVYGGFRLIISRGNAEQIDAGKNAMLAAVTGLAVAFSGYLLIQFASSVIGANSPLF